MITDSIHKHIPEDLIPEILSYKKIHQIPHSFDKYKYQKREGYRITAIYEKSCS